jgi:large subunit ribosomal protein L2
MKNQKIIATSPGKRHQIKQNKKIFSRNTNLLKNNCKIKKNFGRSKQTGRITVRHKGGGNKNKIKILNTSFELNTTILLVTFYDFVSNKILNILFNPFTKKIFLVNNTKDTFIGFIFLQSKNTDCLENGNSLVLLQIPAGSLIHSLTKNKKPIIAKSTGTFGQIIQKNKENCKIRVPSGKILNFILTNTATIGINSNQNRKFCVIGKAGINRNKNKRPSVRGIAMNPVDHPHGGRSNGGKHPTTPWGQLTKGVKTKK